MVIGHLGIVFGLKLLRPRISFFWLAAAAYLPDILRLLLRPIARGLTLNLLSHSLPAIAVEASAAAALYMACRGKVPGAVAIALACCTHYPLDLLTGCKATWPGGPLIGIALYQSPLIDLPIEALFVAAGWWELRKRWPTLAVARGWVLGALVLLQLVALTGIAAQTGFFYLAGVAWRWTPSQSLTTLKRMPPPPRACPQPELLAGLPRAAEQRIRSY